MLSILFESLHDSDREEFTKEVIDALLNSPKSYDIYLLVSQKLDPTEEIGLLLDISVLLAFSLKHSFISEHPIKF